jgi:hypothetical protein
VPLPLNSVRPWGDAQGMTALGGAHPQAQDVGQWMRQETGGEGVSRLEGVCNRRVSLKFLSSLAWLPQGPIAQGFSHMVLVDTWGGL